MAEVFTNVYDILFPSPPALKDIAAIAIAVQLWRQEINTHRVRNTLNNLKLRENVLSSNSISRIPATTMSMIEKYAKRVGLSIENWVDDHYLYLSSSFSKESLKDFIDFVADFDGSIHYVRTAKRFVQCNLVEQIFRFKMACSYCFEDDILQIWSSVSSHDDLKLTKHLFHSNPRMYYWICRSRNQMYKLPRSFARSRSVEEEIFCRSHRTFFQFSIWSSAEYFWNILDSDARIRVITDQEVRFHKPYRYLLSKLNGVELEKFANTKAYKVIYDLICGECVLTCDQSYFNSNNVEDRFPYIMAIWNYIKDKMNENNFFLLIQKMFRSYRDYLPISIPIYCKLWRTAPEHLKAHVIREFFLNDLLFHRDENTKRVDIDGLFLSTALTDASAEDKSSFWNKHWRSLMDVIGTKQLDQLMRLCFSDDKNKIVEIKLNSLSEWENIRETSSRLLNDLSMEDLNYFLNFCCPDEQTRRNIRLNLLVEEFKLDVKNIPKIKPLLNDFINDAYDDVNLAADFKTQLLFSPTTKEKFTELIDSYSCNTNFQHEVPFIDILAPSEEVARDLKKLYVIPLLRQKLIAGNFSSHNVENEFLNFVSECVSDQGQIAKFKETLSIDEIVENVIRSALPGKGKPSYNSFLVQFLEWFFVTPQALEEFKAKYAIDDVFIVLTTKID
ncbi:uncharacterized protein LOC135840818 isoform X4 [Planococcus citri]|uniref:uncharacterized protein LOC135840818 isoform X4 n=1 Tax=Planococcus citri TaxID=170843 RepID=UPI0031F85BE8